MYANLKSQTVVYMPSDMFRIGDSCLYSVFTTQDSLYGTDITLNGINVTWDFSTIGMENQGNLKILNPLSTPFDTAYNQQPDTATHATILKITDLPAPPTFAHFFEINEGYNYFRLSDSAFSLIGLAANMAVPMATIPATNVATHNYEQETIIPFPCKYGAGDTCFVTSFLNIGSTGAFHTYKNKTIHVDGEGTLITPHGTYTGALKVSSHAVSIDTLWAVAMLGPDGMPIYRQINDYYWLVPGYRFPVMHINEHIFDVKFLTVEYLDTTRDIPVYSIDMSVYTLRLKLDDTSRIIATILPRNATNTSLIWESEDTTIAQVNASGLVKAKSVGYTRIFARSLQGNRQARTHVYVSLLDINNNDFSNTIELYPNPAKGIIFIKNNSNIQECELKIFNVCGLKVKQLNKHLFKNGIPINDLENGVYFIEIITEFGKTTKKIIVEN